MENNNNDKENSNEFLNIYANPYADVNFNENEDVNLNNNDNKTKNNEINENKNNNNLSDNNKENKNIDIDKNDKDRTIDKNNDSKNNNNNIKIKEMNNSNIQNNNNNLNNNNDNQNNNMQNNNKNLNNNINVKNRNINKSKTKEKKNKLYTIKETGSHIYIENSKKILVMAIEKSFNKIYSVKDFSEMLNLNPMKTYQVESILGIIDINGNNKYLLVVSSSQFIGSILGADIYNILDVDLIQITLFNESENEKNRITGVKKLFQSNNFYYSNEVDLSSNNLFSKNKKNIITDYCVNSSLLKYFFDNLISNDFYSKIIYGYIGLKKNIEINNINNSNNNNNNNIIFLDSLIIERVNKYLFFNTDIPNQMKEIEFINIYKSKNYNNNSNTNNNNNSNKKYNINIFSFMFYVSNEISNSKIAFNPWNNFIMNELSQYQNIICIINNNINVNLENNININNHQIGDIIFNTNDFGQKIKLLNFTSDWKKNLFFDTNNNSNIYIKSEAISSNIAQEYIFWFIDINNMFHENDNCFNAIIRIMWKSIQL